MMRAFLNIMHATRRTLCELGRIVSVDNKVVAALIKTITQPIPLVYLRCLS